MAAKVEIYPDAPGEYRWRLKARNGRIVCQGESHPTYAAAKRAVEGVALVFMQDGGMPEVVDKREPAPEIKLRSI